MDCFINFLKKGTHREAMECYKISNKHKIIDPAFNLFPFLSLFHIVEYVDVLKRSALFFYVLLACTNKVKCKCTETSIPEQTYNFKVDLLSSSMSIPKKIQQTHHE